MIQAPPSELTIALCKKYQKVKDKEKALAILQDVLDTIAKRHYHASYYITGKVPKAKFTDVLDLQKVVSDVEASCDVCYKGSLLLSKAKLYDEVPVADCGLSSATDELFNMNLNGGACTRMLETVFSRLTVDMMENAFCGRPITESTSSCSDYLHFEATYEERKEAERLLYGAVMFGLRSGDLITRVQLVTENVINNGGVFVVEPVSDHQMSDRNQAPPRPNTTGQRHPPRQLAKEQRQKARRSLRRARTAAHHHARGRTTPHLHPSILQPLQPLDTRRQSPQLDRNRTQMGRTSIPPRPRYRTRH